MKFKRIWIGAGIVASAVLMTSLLLPRQAAAGYFEISAGFSYNSSNFTNTDFEWTRRYGASFGYHLNDLSEIEIAFQDSYDRTKISGYEDTTFHDQVYSANWVQAFTGKNFPIQPYVKIGIGQLNREASGSYAFGIGPPPAELDQITGILGGGVRIFLTKTFGLRGEFTSYLTGGSISTWEDNVNWTAGVSIFF